MLEISDAEYQQSEAEHDADFSEACAGWQFQEEIAYQDRLATSYPQDATAKHAADWLSRQKVW